MTFVLSTMPELVGMEKLGIFFDLKQIGRVRFLTFVLSTMPELVGMEELEIFIKPFLIHRRALLP